MIILTTLGALLTTLGLLVLVLRVLRRAGIAVSPSNPGMPLRVLGRTLVARDQGVVLLQVGERVLLLSSGEGGVRKLEELSPDESARLVDTTSDEPGIPAFHDVFRSAMERARNFRGKPLAIALLLLAGSLILPESALAQGLDAVVDELAPQFDIKMGGKGAGQGLHLSGPVGVVLLMGVLAILPTLILLMTSFTRILIVLHLLRQALGATSAPPTQLLTALALLLTGFIMYPVLDEANAKAVQPYLRGEMTQSQMVEVGIVPFRKFMLENVGESELAVFAEMSGKEYETPEQVPTVVLASAFAISEIKHAFYIGFILFLPFLVIDIVVASSLMSLGMFMLPPVLIALPFKLLLFVLVDGWVLLVQGLALGYK